MNTQKSLLPQGFEHAPEGLQGLSTPMLKSIYSDVTEHFAREGYVRYDRSFIDALVGLRSKGKLDHFLRQFTKPCPLDPYDTLETRKRRYQQFLYNPKVGLLHARDRSFNRDGQPTTRFFQSSEFQSDSAAANINREFAGFTEQQLNDPFLAELIDLDFMLSVDAGILSYEDEYIVGVHLISLEPKVGAKAFTTPNNLHRDGEPVTAVHLLRRENILGGDNVVGFAEAAGHHPSQIKDLVLERFTLEAPFDSFIVDDKRVSHYASDVFQNSSRLKAKRIAMLVDFSPLRIVLSNE